MMWLITGGLLIISVISHHSSVAKKFRHDRKNRQAYRGRRHRGAIEASAPCVRALALVSPAVPLMVMKCHLVTMHMPRC